MVLHGYTSAWCTIPSGVPQGSILGPLLFNLFISDIRQCFKHSYIILYADDMKVHKVIRNFSDTQQLQDDLNRFSAYCTCNKLQLNVAKCYHVAFTRRKYVIDSKYTINSEIISKVGTMKDLGITQDSKLLYDQHIDIIVNKAFRALGFIIRTTACFRSLKPIKILYCSYVRSHLEYASQVWNPQYAIYKTRIEGVQRKFLRYLDYKAQQWSEDYVHRCKRYHFLPLEKRREINDVCLLINIANGAVDCPELLGKVQLRTNHIGFRQRPLLHVPFASTKYRRNAFFSRSARSFNSLPRDLDIDLFCTKSNVVRRRLAKLFFCE